MTARAVTFDGDIASRSRKNSREARPSAATRHLVFGFMALSCAITISATLAARGVGSDAVNTFHAWAAPASTVGLADRKFVTQSARLDQPSYRVFAKSDRLQVASAAAELDIIVPQEITAADVGEAPGITGSINALATSPFTTPISLASASTASLSNIPLPAPRPTTGPSRREAAQANKAMAVASATAASPIKSILEKLFGKAPAPQTLAYAGSDAGILSTDTNSTDGEIRMSPPFDQSTAVYDISARTVYLPDGTKLEAHSGLGDKIDDPRFVHMRMRGATPPHVYDLSLRESLFHGVEALRLKPIGGEDKIHGRTGLLAHTYMLGPKGDSNGCVSFKDYNAFLRAYKNKEIKRLAVIASVN